MKKSRWMILAAAVSIAVFAAAACSQEPEAATPAPTITPARGAIEGIVAEPDGKPLAGMRVSIASGTAPFPGIAPETDAQGRYRLGSVPPGVFDVAVHDRDGNRVGLKSVEVRSAETSTLDFSISAQSASASTPTSGAVAVNFETCEGFLDEPPPDMVSSTIEVTESAKKDNPNIVSMCAVPHQTLDRSSGMTLTVIRFDSTGAAESRFDTIRECHRADWAQGRRGALPRRGLPGGHGRHQVRSLRGHEWGRVVVDKCAVFNGVDTGRHGLVRAFVADGVGRYLQPGLVGRPDGGFQYVLSQRRKLLAELRKPGGAPFY